MKSCPIFIGEYFASDNSLLAKGEDVKNLLKKSRERKGLKIKCNLKFSQDISFFILITFLSRGLYVRSIGIYKIKNLFEIATLIQSLIICTKNKKFLIQFYFISVKI